MTQTHRIVRRLVVHHVRGNEERFFPQWRASLLFGLIRPWCDYRDDLLSPISFGSQKIAQRFIDEQVAHGGDRVVAWRTEE